MLLLVRRERAPKLDGRVAVRATRGDGVPEYLAAALLRPVGGFVCLAILDFSQDGERFPGRDFCDRATAEVWKDVFFEPLEDLVVVVLGPLLGEAGDPLPGDGLEAVGRALGDRGASSM
jgi:hypothetical protein